MTPKKPLFGDMRLIKLQKRIRKFSSNRSFTVRVYYDIYYTAPAHCDIEVTAKTPENAFSKAVDNFYAAKDAADPAEVEVTGTQLICAYPPIANSDEQTLDMFHEIDDQEDRKTE